MAVQSNHFRNNQVGSLASTYCKRLNFRGLKFSQSGPKLKI
ncbi:MAG: hypothetical protein PV344_06260 [Anaplasma sp.]|nr:hypothetical protein [Anaplasma sp.]